MNGTGYSSKLVLPNNLYSLMASKAFTDELGKKARLDALDRAKVCLGLEEAILNVITHSYAAAYPEGTTAKDVDTYPESGLGFQIMRSSFDQVMVRNHPGGKELHLIKYLPLSDDESRMAGIAGE